MSKRLAQAEEARQKLARLKIVQEELTLLSAMYNKPSADDDDETLMYFWAQQQMQSLLFEEEQLQLPAKKQELTRRYYPRLDPLASPWFVKYLSDENPMCWHPEYRDRAFRNRFRLPIDLFNRFISICETKKWFPNRGDIEPAHRVAGVNRKPFKLLVLGSLSYLAGTGSWQVIADCTHISPRTLSCFFEEFIRVGEEKMYTRWVTPPTNEELKEQMAKMEAAGLPGCYACSDGVQFRQFCSYAHLKGVSVGKEGFTTRGYNLSATYGMRIIHVQGGFPGSWNDMGKAKHDELFHAIRDKMLPAPKYVLKSLDGTEKEDTTSWLLVDNGYINEPHLIAPPNWSHDIDSVFRCWLESVRKLVECTFSNPDQQHTNTFIRCYRSVKAALSDFEDRCLPPGQREDGPRGEDGVLAAQYDFDLGQRKEDANWCVARRGRVSGGGAAENFHALPGEPSGQLPLPHARSAQRLREENVCFD